MCIVSVNFKFLYLDSVRTGALVLNCDAILVAPTPALVEEEVTIMRIGMVLERKNLAICHDGTRSQEQLCWRRPAAAYYYARKLKEIQKQYYDSFRSTRQKILREPRDPERGMTALANACRNLPD
jgi:hypothetical protein